MIGIAYRDMLCTASMEQYGTKPLEKGLDVMRYPLPETIGDPDLLVGRKKEFARLDKWIGLIPRRGAKSRALLARRKSGKTAIVQRIFNRLWTESGRVVPFYINIRENRVWFPAFAVHYFKTFASQFISFLERDESPVENPLSLEEIREYAATRNLVQVAKDCDFIIRDFHSDKKGTSRICSGFKGYYCTKP